jgi:hypothetical protein
MATSRPVPPAEYSTYPLEKLRALWGRGELTEAQMIGHLLQHQLDQENRLRRLEQPGRPPEEQPRQ